MVYSSKSSLKFLISGHLLSLLYFSTLCELGLSMFVSSHYQALDICLKDEMNE